MNSSLPVPKASPSSSTSHAPVIGVGGWFFWTEKKKRVIERQMIIGL
jgi:hypothetical protein